MRVRELIEHWERATADTLTAERYEVRLPVRDAARIKALAEMYPRHDVGDIITDLLSAALEELEECLPYTEGGRVIAEDDQGDPIYEDVGPTARFRDLTRKHARALRGESAGGPRAVWRFVRPRLRPTCRRPTRRRAEHTAPWESSPCASTVAARGQPQDGAAAAGIASLARASAREV